MAKGTVVKVDKVKPYCMELSTGKYYSRMLIDQHNSGSQKLQVNHGQLKPGSGVPGGDHPPDEIYIVLNGRGLLNLDGEEHIIEKGSVVFIPGGTFHAVKNIDETEDFEIITVWPGQKATEGNEVYEKRIEEWGTSYQEIL